MISGADAVANAEGNMGERVMRAPAWPDVVLDPGMSGSSLRGNWEVSWSTEVDVGRRLRRSASGRRGAEADDVRS